MAMKLPFATLPLMPQRRRLVRHESAPTAIPPLAGHLFSRIRSLSRYASRKLLLYDHYAAIGGKRWRQLL